MKLLLVRHGETYENLMKISQGHLNSRLTSKGLEQAKDVAKRLKDEKIDIVYSSDLDRAVKTCDEIIKFHSGVVVVKTELLREQCKGVYEGRPRGIRDDFLENKKIKYFDFKPEGGESMVDLWNKVIPFFEKIKKDNTDKSVLIVSHGGPISCLLAYLHGQDVSFTGDYRMGNTAVSVAEISEAECRFVELCCDRHL